MSLKIVVCVKHVPDAAGDRGFADDRTLDRENLDGILSELDEYGVEQALQIAEAHGDAEVTALTVGPPDARSALQRTLAMGADNAIHIMDEAIHGSDVMATSAVVASAVAKTGFDLLLCGMASTDGAMGVLPALLAERLGVPHATLLSQVALDDGQIVGQRESDTVTEQVTTPLPAVISVTDQSGDVRYPSFNGIMAAKKKPVVEWSLSEVRISPTEVGLDNAATRVETITARPPRAAGTVITDDGNGGQQLAAFLAAQKLT